MRRGGLGGCEPLDFQFHPDGFDHGGRQLGDGVGAGRVAGAVPDGVDLIEDRVTQTGAGAGDCAWFLDMRKVPFAPAKEAPLLGEVSGEWG